MIHLDAVDFSERRSSLWSDTFLLTLSVLWESYLHSTLMDDVAESDPSVLLASHM